MRITTTHARYRVVFVTSAENIGAAPHLSLGLHAVKPNFGSAISMGLLEYSPRFRPRRS
jgi:hypothetical protein